MDWEKFGYAVAGGLCGALLTQLTTVARDWWTRHDSARFTALMLALALEDYADRCFGTFSERENFDPQRSQDEPDTDVPNLPAYDDATNWRALGIHLTSRVMDFRVKVSAAHEYCRTSWMETGKTGAWGDAATKAVELGVGAFDVADELRKRFKLKAAESRGYDVAGRLRAELKEMDARHAEWMKRRPELFPSEK